MSFKILTNIGVDNTNIEAAVFNEFVLSGKNTIVKNYLNECNIILPSSNSIAVDTGEFIIKGHLIINDSLVLITLNNTPTTDILYQLILRLTVDELKNVSCSILVQSYSDLTTVDINQSAGTYEVELATFIHSTDGTIKNLVKKLFPKFNYAIDSELSEESENALQNKEITKELNKRVAKEEGKVLSSNDYTNEEKEKLAEMEGTISAMIDEAKQDVDPVPSAVESEMLYVPNTVESEQLFDKLKIYNQSYQSKNLLTNSQPIINGGVQTLVDAGYDVDAKDRVFSFYVKNFSFTGNGAFIDLLQNDGTHNYRTGISFRLENTGEYLTYNTLYTGRIYIRTTGSYRYLNFYGYSGGYAFMSGTIYNAQLEEGTNPTSFEPAGGMCTPTSLNEIIDTPAGRTTKTNNNNLLLFLNNTGDYKILENKIDVKINNGKMFITNSTGIEFFRYTDFKPFANFYLPAGIYTITNMLFPTTTGYCACGLRRYDNDTDIITLDTNNSYKTFTTTEKLRVYFRVYLKPNTPFTNVEFKIMLASGNTKKEYIPLQHDEIAYVRKDINGVEYVGRSAGAVYDRDDIENGKFYEDVGKWHNTGGWSKGTGNDDMTLGYVNTYKAVRCYRPLPNCLSQSYKKDILSNMYTVGTEFVDGFKPYSMCRYTNNVYCGVALADIGYGNVTVTVENLSAIMAAAAEYMNGLTDLYFNYPLAVPIEHTFHPDELAKLRKIKSFNGGTWLTSDSRLIFNAENLLVDEDANYFQFKFNGKTGAPYTKADAVAMNGKKLNECINLISPDGSIWDMSIGNNGVPIFTKRS